MLSLKHVRMVERSKALRSGRSPLLWAWARISLLRDALWEGCVQCASENLLSSEPRAIDYACKQCNAIGVRVFLNRVRWV